MSTLLVTGATGFIGSRLVPILVEAGHEVRAMTRRPEEYDGPGTPVGGDVHQPDTLSPALEGVDVAYYFVHSLDSDDFEEQDARAARAFGRAAADAGVQRIVYLGGLGDEDGELSAHLRSRREVEGLLGEAGVPVTVLRAAIIIGAGGISWEITRQLVKNLPAMIVPKWARTRTQPIALDDVIGYLTDLLDEPETIGKVYEIGGPEVLTYTAMLRDAALVMNGRDVVMLEVPVLTPGLSSYWLALVTDVDATTGRNLIDSMGTEVVVHDDSITRVLPRETIGYQEAVRRALEDGGR